MTGPPDYVVIVDPNSLRWAHYQSALEQHLEQFEIRSKIHVLEWAEVIRRDGNIADQLPTGPFLLRIESPGREFSLFRALMQAGEVDGGQEPTLWDTAEQGWIASPRLLYRGLCRIVSRVSECVESHGRCIATSNLSDTLKLFDKNATSSVLTEHGIATPDFFHPEQGTDTITEIRKRDWPSAYVKLAFGSCASGIACVDTRHRQSSATTSVTELDGRYYNTRALKTVKGEELRRVLSFLVEEIATVQLAVNKSRLNGDNFDVRVVVIGREPVASVFRVSPFPMTNLHLGGYRGDPAACRRVLSDRAWAEALDLCRRAAQLFSMAALGIDLAFDRHTLEPQIIEINAFGDFFPGWTDAQGQTIHQLEIASTFARYAESIS